MIHVIRKTGKTKLVRYGFLWLKKQKLYEYEAIEYFDVGCGLRGEETTYIWNIF